MKPTRRLFLTSVTAGVGAVGLGATHATSWGPRHATAQARSPLSPAVVDAVREALVSASKRTAAGTLRSSDLRVAAASVKTFFRHLDELGFVDRTQKAFEDEKLRLEYDEIPEDVIQRMHADLANAGVPMSVEKLRTSLRLFPDERSRAVAEIEKAGVRRILLRVSGRLEGLADRLDRRRGPRLQSALHSVRPAQELEAEREDPCNGLREVLHTLGLIVAISGGACLLPGFGMGFCIAAAVEGILYAMLDMAIDWMCG